MTLNRVAIPSPNYSSRGGQGVRLIVLHTAEGSTTYQSLGSYFASSSSGVSSHAGIDDTPNEIGVYVKRTDKAWTAANANPVAVQAELCAFAAWTPAEWQNHPTMLANAAAWVAEEAAAFGIPIRKLSAAEAQGGAAGVCQHRDLGTWGGNHSDCGAGFPIDQVLDMARGGGQPAPPTPTKKAPTMKVIQGKTDNRVFVTDGITKRHIMDPTQELPDLLALCEQTAPATVWDYTVDRLPEILPVDAPNSVVVDLDKINQI